MRICPLTSGLLTALVVTLGSMSISAAQPDGIIKRADQLNDEGKDLFGRGELDDAASKFRAAIALSPQARYFFNLCFVLNARKEYRAALGACHEVRTSPGNDDRLLERTDQLIVAIEKKRKAAGDERPLPPPRDPPPVVKDPPPGTDPPVNPPNTVQPDPNAPPPITTPPGTRPPIAGFVQPRDPRVGIVVNELPPRLFHIGANLGFSTASLSGSDADVSSVRPGFTAGIWAASSFSRQVAGQVELAYVQRGGSGTGFNASDVDFDIELNYITVPVLAKVLLPIGRLVRLHGDGGFALSFLTSSSSEAFRFDGNPPPQLFNQPGVDFSLIIGGGLTMHRQGRNAWTFDFRYELGLADVSPEGLPDMTSRTTTFRVGYAY